MEEEPHDIRKDSFIGWFLLILGILLIVEFGILSINSFYYLNPQIKISSHK